MTAKDLKNALLQEAVSGKLTEGWRKQQASLSQTNSGSSHQRTTNAKDLLEEIRKEKSKLIKEGKLKKEKPLPEITEEEIPFDIPDNWCWCKLGDIVNKLTDGTHRTPKYVEKGIPFLSVKNLSSGKMDFENTKYITLEEHKELYARCNPEKGDMLLTKVGTTGIPVINDSDIEFSLFVSVALIKFNHDFLDAKFFLYLLQSPLVQEQAKENTRGVGNKNWVMDAIANTILVLPPLDEQKRIVATIEKFMPLIEEYDKKETELKALNEQIGTLTKKAILQEAVQGKLVPQIAADGNAKDLLEEIKKEKAKLIKEGKIKKEKPLSEISEDEIPFDIPENWCWCRLGEIVSVLGDGIHGTPNYDIQGEYHFINGNNLSDGKIMIKQDTKKVNEVEYQKYKKELNENTVFVSINGTLGNIAFYNNEKLILGKSACYFNLIKNEMKNFIYWIIKTTYFLDYATQEATGTTIKNVSLATMRNFPIPIPPLAEQKRIVETIEQLVLICEQLRN